MIRCDTTALILAGGRAQRMAGRDKGLVELNGVPLVQWVVAAIRQQVGDILISANRSLDHYQALGFQVVQDLQTDFPGPLAGVLAGFDVLTTGELLVVPCDVPLLPRDLVMHMRAKLVGQVELVIAADPHRIHPAIFLCRASVRDSLREFVSTGRRQVRAWQSELNTNVCYFDDPVCFTNLNAMDQVDALAALLNGQ
ncbi:molybdenum cofactor guanylyltransferase MobA [Chitinivorax sp. B]|uniref:molybdenum cofactor guanylyltransferase MobA n=1 Tax=Chitinivorax sp. B TaxID=2502235 RepID=UPI0010F733EE|nr:molybdenum cofactor guanylyltransferase MobA [Chitinivorax sp. B]